MTYMNAHQFVDHLTVMSVCCGKNSLTTCSILGPNHIFGMIETRHFKFDMLIEAGDVQ